MKDNIISLEILGKEYKLNTSLIKISGVLYALILMIAFVMTMENMNYKAELNALQSEVILYEENGDLINKN